MSILKIYKKRTSAQKRKKSYSTHYARVYPTDYKHSSQVIDWVAFIQDNNAISNDFLIIGQDLKNAIKLYKIQEK